MARILIEGGGLSWSATASNAAADRVLTAAARHLGYTGLLADRQAILDFIGPKIVDYLRAQAAAFEETELIDAAVSSAAADRPGWSA